MLYSSTRNAEPSCDARPFSGIVLEGIAPDGGLYVPQAIPELSTEELRVWSGKTYEELAEILLRLFAPELEGEIACSLQTLIADSTRRFRSTERVVLRQLGESSLYVGELFHGPTYAFKDVALQFLGQVFDQLLQVQGRKLYLLGATSGDTGGAAIYGVRNMKNIQLSILHPYNGVSEVQRKQMCSVLDENICNIAVQGNFDQCQSMVKEIMERSKHDSQIPHLGAINSINWGRILAQMTYYFALYFRVCVLRPSFSLGDPLRFIVPTGNFGNVLAAFFAKRMGLPIELQIATNQNDILYQLLSRNEYCPSQQVQASFAPAMDIVQPSNFERYLYFLFGGDSEMLCQFVQRAKAGEVQQLSREHYAQLQKDFCADHASDEQILAAISHCYENYAYLLDPHTACAYHAYQNLAESQSAVEKLPSICLATAHPAKFPETYSALVERWRRQGHRTEQEFAKDGTGLYEVPVGLDFSDAKERYSVLEADCELLLQFLQTHVWVW